MNSDLTTMNNQVFCRICLRSDKTLYGLFDSITPDIESPSSDVFTVWRTFVKILKNTDENISLPDRICQDCRSEILGAYSFARKCEKAKTICAQMKCVTVRLAKLKSLPSKCNLQNKFMPRNCFKKTKPKQFHIPLKAVKWAYNSEPLKRPKLNGVFERKINFDDHDDVDDDDDGDDESSPPKLVNNCEVVIPLKDDEHNLTERSSFKCEICQQTFAMKISYNRHIRTHTTQKGSIECPICQARFTSQSVFEVHSFMHSVNKKKMLNHFNCSKCPRKFSNQATYNAHLRSHKVDQKKDDKLMMDEHRCDICNKLFYNARALSSHRHRHVKKNKCVICSKSFMTKAQLVNHLAHHKVMKPFACNVCKKAFSDKLRLTDHLRSHRSDHGSQLCSLCGQQFDDSQQYMLHIENHKCNDSSVSPRENVNQENLNQENFELNPSVNTIDVPQANFQYGCDICEARFPKHVDLIRHKQIHTKDSSHVCEICEQKFNLAYALKLHMRIHSDGKQLDCGLCGESFEHDSELSEHMTIHRSLSVQSETASSTKKAINNAGNNGEESNILPSQLTPATEIVSQQKN